VQLMEGYRALRLEREGFGDFCHRLGQEALLALLPPCASVPTLQISA
jgi:hypothetical protein